MSGYKTVLLPIKVPDCKYCWEEKSPFRICSRFDNEGGHPMCELNIAPLMYDVEGGVRKPKKCLELNSWI